MPKTISIPNQKHPRNLMNGVGNRAKKIASALSNEALDAFIAAKMEDPAELAEVMTWTRGRKIKLIRWCAMHDFAHAWQKAAMEKAAKGKDGE